MDIRNIPEDTYNNLKVLAQMAGCSLNQLANDILEDYVSTQKMNQVKNDLADRI
ncbi:FitA-like ribbon-helix-helix domain-containing protein, partial [Staphylococcus pseudintermedius]